MKFFARFSTRALVSDIKNAHISSTHNKEQQVYCQITKVETQIE